MSFFGVAILARHPQDIVGSVVVHDLSQHEQQIGQAIEIDRRLRIDQFDFRESQHCNLDAATDGSSHMQVCGGN